MLEFILKVVKNKKKEYITLLLITSLLASFVFSALSLYDTINKVEADMFNKLINNVLPAFIAFISLFLITYVLKYFINNKKQEFSLLLLTGRKMKDMFAYVMMQYGTIILISFMIGILGGIITNELIKILMTLLQYPFDFHYSLINTLFVYFFFFIFTIIFSLTICTYQFNILTMNLLDYLTKHRTQETKHIKYDYLFNEQKSKTKPYILLLFSFFLIFIMIYSTIKIFDTDYDYIMLYYMLITASTIYLINKFIPIIYELFHKPLLNKPILAQGLMAFTDFTNTMLTILVLNSAIMPVMSIVTTATYYTNYIQYIMIPCFIMITIMIGLCFVLKYTFYKEKIISYLSTFHAIGYKHKQLKLIYLLKNIIFIILGIITPFIIFIIFIYKSYESYLMTFTALIMITSTYFITYFIILIYMIITENKLIKEVKPYV